MPVGNSCGFAVINKEKKLWAVFHPHVDSEEKEQELFSLFSSSWDKVIAEQGCLLIIFTEGCYIDENFFTKLFTEKFAQFRNQRIPLMVQLRSLQFDTRVSCNKEEAGEFLANLFVDCLQKSITGGLHDKD